jgi:hypothetical protein
MDPCIINLPDSNLPKIKRNLNPEFQLAYRTILSLWETFHLYLR